MALRVLLADESSTIKKVIQLALQDFAVEVKSVHSGVDVLEVAKSFKPDLIFADVLLQKRNGYEATAELKSDFETKGIPVIMMWSSFMELDEAAFKKSQANARLEKPFDAESLRSMVTDLVPKTRTQSLSSHLEFPSAAFPREQAAAPTQAPTTAPKTSVARPAETPRMFELSEEDNSPFQFGVLPQPHAPSSPTAHEDSTAKGDDGENWSHQNLSQFNVNLEPLKIESDNVTIEFDVQHGELEGEKRILATPPAPPTKNSSVSDQTISRTGYLAPHTRTTANPLFEEIDVAPTQIGNEPVLSSFETENGDDMQIPRMNPAFNAPAGYHPEERRASPPPVAPMSADELERIVRAQSRDIIEELVRKIVPELASEMIRAELSRLIDTP